MYAARGRGTSTYFNNFTNSQEQQLWENLIIESIRIFGQDMFYLPKTQVSYDEIYGEDDQTAYNLAIPIELYIKSVDGFEGDGVFLSKLGLQIQDQVTFTVAKKIFEQEVTAAATITRPNEGDLIYFPLNKKLFQIQYTNYKPFFYQFGELQTYDLTCILFEYSNEVLNTGIPEIDELQTKFSTNALDYSLLTQEGNALITQEGNYLVQESYATNEYQDETEDNSEIQEESEDIFVWNEKDPFSSGTY